MKTPSGRKVTAAEEERKTEEKDRKMTKIVAYLCCSVVSHILRWDEHLLLINPSSFQRKL